MKYGRLVNKRVAVYQRYSSDHQNEVSLTDQLHRNKQFVEREGGDPSKVIPINDAAVSGSRFLRSGFTELLRLAEEGKIDAVVAEDLSRLNRDTEHAAALLKRLARAGVTIYSVSDGIDTSQSGSRLTYAMKAAFAENYLAELGDKTLRGLEGRARRGFATGGKTYGFRTEPVPDGLGNIVGHKIIVRPEEAIVLERMFEEYASGLSTAAIAHGLNRDKIPSPRSVKPKRLKKPKFFPDGWSASTVRAMLHNAVYVGVRRYKERRSFKQTDLGRQSEGRVFRKRPSEDVITATGPRIIDQDLWDRVQSRLAAVRVHYTKTADGKPKGRAASPGRATTHLLSGVMQCTCGASMTLVGGSSMKYYGCNNNKKRGPHICPNKLTVREDVARESVLGALGTRLLSAEGVTFLREQIAVALGGQGRSNNTELDERRKRLDRHEARIASLVQFIAEGDASDYVRASLKDFEAQARAEKAAIRELEAVASKPVRLPSPDEVLSKARNLERTLIADPTRGREMLLELFQDGRLTLEPQPEGHYLARSQWFPLLALVSAPNTTTPRSFSGPGRLDGCNTFSSATALGCAGRI